MAIDQPDSGADEDKILEALPDDVVASLEVRNAWRQRMVSSSPPLEFFISHLASWTLGAVLHMAFLDGDTSLHLDIVEATEHVTDVCNLTLDFGLNSTAEYRRWSETDTVLTAEIRVSFDQSGHWSLAAPTAATRRSDLTSVRWVAGPGSEASTSVASSTAGRRIGVGRCATSFSTPSPSNMSTRASKALVNACGVFVPDSAGRWPGIYTCVAGRSADRLHS